MRYQGRRCPEEPWYQESMELFILHSERKTGIALHDTVIWTDDICIAGLGRALGNLWDQSNEIRLNY